mmetsp:Transcript_155615/g.274847  ORF Transcript_155615/g.274847 Transcript_155615/m.274847 type:complete len:238 (+) Transcript_155615:574-1287(+)
MPFQHHLHACLQAAAWICLPEKRKIQRVLYVEALIDAERLSAGPRKPVDLGIVDMHVSQLGNESQTCRRRRNAEVFKDALLDNSRNLLDVFEVVNHACTTQLICSFFQPILQLLQAVCFQEHLEQIYHLWCRPVRRIPLLFCLLLQSFSFDLSLLETKLAPSIFTGLYCWAAVNRISRSQLSAQATGFVADPLWPGALVTALQLLLAHGALRLHLGPSRLHCNLGHTASSLVFQQGQ